MLPADPAQVTAAVREAIQRADPALPVFQVWTMEELRQRGFWQFRLFGVMFFLFGAIALVLASIGVYGVLSYSVSQRTQEIGVRVALGADATTCSAGCRAGTAAGRRIGVVFGIAGAVAAAPADPTVLYNVKPTDPVSFIGVSFFLVLTAIVASYFPARRAMAVDPLTALRRD